MEPRLTAREWDKKLDEAMDAMNRKGVHILFSTPDWMQRSEAEQRGALEEYLWYRTCMEELCKAADRERYENGTPVQMELKL